MEKGFNYDDNSGISLTTLGGTPLNIASSSIVSIGLTGNNTLQLYNFGNNNAFISYGVTNSYYWSEGLSVNGGLNDWILYDNVNYLTRVRLSNQGLLSITGTLSVSNGITSNYHNVLNTTPEYRLTTSGDNYYSRLQRSSTGNTTYLKAQVNRIGGVGYGLSTNGTSYWTAPSTGLPSGTASVFSISFWLFVRSTGFSGTIISYGNTSGNYIVMYSFGTVNWKIDFNGGNKALSSTLTANRWYHYVITSDGSTVTLYQNGIIAPTTAGTAQFSATLSITPGVLQSTSPNGSGNYIYDQVLFYNTALSITDVSTLYSSGNGTPNPPSSANLLRRYDWEQNAIDSVGGYTASLVSSPTYVSGKVLITGGVTESTPLTYTDGVNAGESGTLYLGDISSSSYLQGLSIKSYISSLSIYPFIIGSNGKVYISSANSSSSTLGLSDLSVSGGVAIGSYATTITAPTNGLIVSGNVGIGTSSTTYALYVSGTTKATQFAISALNTAPISSTASGVLGDIIIDGNYIYFCKATNTWVRSALTTF